MRFYLRLIAMVLALLLLLLGLQMLGEGSGQRASATPTPAPPTPTPVPGLVTPPPGWTPSIVMPTAAIPQRTAAPRVQAAPAAAPSPGACGAVRQAATQVGATVASCGQDGGLTVATIQARERNHLGDFLDAAMRLGMRDFDVNKTNYRVFQRGSQTVHEATYRMRW